jgi:hypothetical protein
MIQISDFSVHNMLTEAGDEWVEADFNDCSGENFTPTQMSTLERFHRSLPS